MSTIRELKRRLENHSDDEPCAWSIWLGPDVKQAMDTVREQAQENDEVRPPKLTDEEIAEVLESMHNDQDATVGLSWSTLEYEVGKLEGPHHQRTLDRLIPGLRVLLLLPEGHRLGSINSFASYGSVIKMTLTCGWSGEVAPKEIEIVEEGDEDEEA